MSKRIIIICTVIGLFILAIITLPTMILESVARSFGKDKQHGVYMGDRLKQDLIISITDSLNKKYAFFSPPKKLERDIVMEYCVELDPKDTYYTRRLYYFKEPPEEVYVVSYIAGLGEIEFVYDVRIQTQHYLRAEWDHYSEQDENNLKARVKKRFKNEVLDVIEREAKKEGIPDSLIYN